MGANARARGAQLLTDGDLNRVENYIEPLEDAKLHFAITQKHILNVCICDNVHV